MPGTTTMLLTLAVLLPLIAARSTNSTEECRVSADPDTLGLGVRLGLYFQTLSNLFLLLPRFNEACDSLVPTQFFFTGFLAAVVYSFATQSPPPGAMIACTWYPYLLIVALFFIRPSTTEGHPKLRAFWAVLLLLASLVLNIWFWFRGVHLVQGEQCMEPRVFLFANLGALGGIRIVFATLSAGIFGFCMCVILVSFWRVKRRMRTKVADAEGRLSPGEEKMEPTANSPEPTTVELRSPSTGVSLPPSNTPTDGTVQITAVNEIKTDDESQQHRLLTPAETAATPDEQEPNVEWKLTTIYSFTVSLILYIIASELQLKWNHLDGLNKVSSTGQIIPLTLGSLSLLRSIWLLKELKLWGLGSALKNI